eukprot:m.146813 g.146813  ORF g.146813 m.146813 type:complete len:153 (+) comp17267_c0_seq1:675-1133(+)
MVYRTFRDIFQTEGWRGCYRGLRPTLVSVTPFVACQQASYDCLKYGAYHLGAEPSTPLFLACGAAAGIISQIVIHPLDVVRRQMQVSHDVGAAAPGYRTILRRLARDGGVRSLFAGIQPSLLKVAPAVALTVLIRDALLGRLEPDPDASGTA